VNDRRLHFGLGAEPAADVEVRWPSGIRQSFKAVASYHLVTIDETRGIVYAKVLEA
jgi:enediyne biosynthesis protein E4